MFNLFSSFFGGGQSTAPQHQSQSSVQRQEAQGFRQKADAQAKEMRQSYQKADDCGWVTRKLGWDKDYREEGRDHRNKMIHYNKQAKTMFLAANNEQNGPHKLDVHGLHPHEAKRAVNQRMRQVGKLEVITGYGLHSPDGTAKVKPAIEKDLRDRGNKVKHDRRNPGVVIASRSNGHRNASSHSNGHRNASTGGGGSSNASGAAKRRGGK